MLTCHSCTPDKAANLQPICRGRWTNGKMPRDWRFGKLSLQQPHTDIVLKCLTKINPKTRTLVKADFNTRSISRSPPCRYVFQRVWSSRLQVETVYLGSSTELRARERGLECVFPSFCDSVLVVQFLSTTTKPMKGLHCWQQLTNKTSNSDTCFLLLKQTSYFATVDQYTMLQ